VTLFSKPLQRPGNMKVLEARDVTKPVGPGADFDWRLSLTNGSTQPRELLSIEMPHQARLLFKFGGKTPSENKPIRLLPGGSHSQQIKFNSRATGNSQGVFKATLLFNFSCASPPQPERASPRAPAAFPCTRRVPSHAHAGGGAHRAVTCTHAHLRARPCHPPPWTAQPTLSAAAKPPRPNV
jgi:hypothetical protein